VTFKPAFTEAEVGFIQRFMNTLFLSELTFRINDFNREGKLGIESKGLVRKEEGVKGVIRKLKRQPVSSSAGCASGY